MTMENIEGPHRQLTASGESGGLPEAVMERCHVEMVAQPEAS